MATLFLKTLRKNACDFIDNVKHAHDSPFDDSDWECFRHYMGHLSKFAMLLGEASFSAMNVFLKERLYFSELFKASKVVALSLSQSLAENSKQLAQTDFNHDSLSTTMKHQCLSMFVAVDELLRLLDAVDKIQPGSAKEFRTEEFGDNCQLFITSMRHLIGLLPFCFHDKEVLASNKLNSLLCLHTECQDKSRQNSHLTLTAFVTSAVESSRRSWDQFLNKCFLEIQKNSQKTGEFIGFFEEYAIKSFEQLKEKWEASLSHVALVVRLLFEHQEAESPVYDNLAKFTNFQLHPSFQKLLVSKFVESTDVVVSTVLDSALSLIRQIDILFLKMRSYCSDPAVSLECNERYQKFSDLLQFCKQCFEVDRVWHEQAELRGQSQSLQIIIDGFSANSLH